MRKASKFIYLEDCQRQILISLCDTVGPTGFGLMRMTWHPEPIDDELAFKILKKALESGSNFWNSGMAFS